jgi:hypothetical protein
MSHFCYDRVWKQSSTAILQSIYIKSVHRESSMPRIFRISKIRPSFRPSTIEFEAHPTTLRQYLNSGALRELDLQYISCTNVVITADQSHAH